jgi:hypothetical protein
MGPPTNDADTFQASIIMFISASTPSYDTVGSHLLLPFEQIQRLSTKKNSNPFRVAFQITYLTLVHSARQPVLL